MADPVLEALKGGGASSATLDADAKTLTISGAAAAGSGGDPSDLTAKHTLTTASGRELSYALGALYLCLSKPDQSYVAYRKECKELGIEACKVTERKDVLEYFGVAEGGAAGGAGDSAAAGAAPAAAAAAAAPSDKKDAADDRKRSSSSSRDKDRRRSSGGRDKDRGKDKRKESHEERKARKLREKEEADRRQKEKDEAAARLRAQKKERAKTGMTNEQLMEGLDVVVDKRDEDELGGGAAVSGGKTTGLDGAGGDGAAASSGAAAAAAAAGAPTPTVLSEEEKEEEEERRQHALVIQSLSSAGFEVGGMADAIESDRKAVEAITAMEIPVGNSASVLRCGAGVGDARRDFSRVLELYIESLKAEERAKRAAAGGGSGSGSGSGGPPGSDRKRSSSGGDRWGPKDPKRAKGGDAASSSKSGGRTTPSRPKATGPPIIVVPNAMTSPITLVNATDFFGNATFVPRDVALKKAGGNASLAQLRKETVMVRHKVAPRLGGREIDFEIVDNPTTRLRNPADWDRVVAVVAQGAEWQFKGWRHAKPVDLFGRCFGFYVGIEGAPIPKELLGWNVKIGKLNRDKRGLDSVTFASFWNGLSEWMHVNKPEYLKLESEGA